MHSLPSLADNPYEQPALSVLKEQVECVSFFYTCLAKAKEHLHPFPIWNLDPLIQEIFILYTIILTDLQVRTLYYVYTSQEKLGNISYESVAREVTQMKDNLALPTLSMLTETVSQLTAEEISNTSNNINSMAMSMCSSFSNPPVCTNLTKLGEFSGFDYNLKNLAWKNCRTLALKHKAALSNVLNVKDIIEVLVTQIEKHFFSATKAATRTTDKEAKMMVQPLVIRDSFPGS